LALDEDGEIKAAPSVALIVVAGVEVKETSQESACCRFLQNPNEISLSAAIAASNHRPSVLSRRLARFLAIRVSPNR
jgi:hypothetical protein